MWITIASEYLTFNPFRNRKVSYTKTLTRNKGELQGVRDALLTKHVKTKKQQIHINS